VSVLKSLLAASAVAAACCSPPPASAQNTPGVLRVSAIPDEAPTELQRKFKPLGDYLAKATGLKVEFTPVTDYAASVEGLINHKLDMVWFGGFTFVQANVRSKGQVVPLVQRAEDEKFRSVFITTSTRHQQAGRPARQDPVLRFGIVDLGPPDAAFVPVECKNQPGHRPQAHRLLGRA
jgi:phosphonate transport system substrate-binding protein